MTSTNDATIVTYNRALAQFPKGGQAERLSLRYGLPSFISHAGSATLVPATVNDTVLGADGAKLVGSGTAAQRDRIATPNYFKHAVGGNAWSCSAVVKFVRPDGVAGDVFVGLSNDGIAQDFDSITASFVGVRISGDDDLPTFTAIAGNFANIAPASVVTLGTISPGGTFPRHFTVSVDFDGKNTKFSVDNHSLSFELGNATVGTGQMLSFVVNNDMSVATGNVTVRELALGYEAIL